MEDSTAHSNRIGTAAGTSSAAQPRAHAPAHDAHDDAQGDTQEETEGNVQTGARSSARRPMISGAEIATLARKYGAPVRLRYAVQADEYIHSYRWRKDSDRRAEVVFAIQDPSGQLWVHAKPHYPAHIFRLPSGGICWDEGIEAALLREVEEETGLNVRVERFLGVLDYTFYYGGTTAQFASYVFHLLSRGGVPVPAVGETICEFRPIPPGRISEVAVDLRNLMGDRRGWGQWRALAHDLVYESLFNQSLSSKGNFVC
ncbi:MAG: NUDIX hydrolase [Litorilinea sp.]